MTIEMSQFGKFLITRHDASHALSQVSPQQPLVLDFAGVEVANHCFIDQFAKGLHVDLERIEIVNANAYTLRCIEAGFKTANSSIRHCV